MAGEFLLDDGMIEIYEVSYNIETKFTRQISHYC
jgi:hypothetical protein